MAFTLLDLERIIAGLRRRLRLLEIQGNTNILKTGLQADLPDGPSLDLAPGTTISYYATDTKTLSVYNIVSGTWDTVIFT